MVKAIFRMAGVLVFALFACGLGSAQVDESTGTIRGTVYDSKNLVIPNATVTVTNPETGVVRTTVTGPDGTYQVPQLNPATYAVQATAPGFQREKANEVVLTVGQTIVLDGHLLVGSESQVVEVYGNVTPLIDVEQTQQANTLDQNQIQFLPNIGRNFINEVLTLPGIGSTAGAAAQFTGFFYGSTGLAVGGSNGRGNLITVNSGEDDYGTGAVRYFPPLDSVQEEQVNRNGYQPEFGFSSGAAINVVTKSGTNALHGDAFGFLTDRYTIAETYLTKLTNPTATKPYYQSYFAGASLGGPIVKDKLFFFAAYEFNHVDSAVIINNAGSPYLQPFNGSQGDTSCLTTPTTTPSQYCLLQVIAQKGGAYDPQDAMLAQEFLNSPNVSPTNPNAPNPFFPGNDPNVQKLGGAVEGVFDNPTRTSNMTSRFDYLLSNNNTINGTFSFEHGSNYVGGTTPDSLFSPTRDYEATVDWVHIFSPRVYNKVLVQYAYNRFDQNTINSTGPEISIQYLGGPLGSFGHASTATYLARQHREEFSDDLSVTKGKHNMKVGASFRPAQYSINNPNFGQGEFDFDGGFPLTPIGGIGFPGFNGQAYGVPSYAALPYLLGALGFCPPPAPNMPPSCIPASANLTATQLFSDAVPYSFEGSSGSGLVNFKANYGAIYAQDLWKVNPRFTLTFGGRLDIDAEASPLSTYKVFSPRAGFAWTPFADSKTLIRGGGGVFATPTNFLEPFYTNLYGPLTGTNPYLTTTAVDVLEGSTTPLGFYTPILSLYQANLGPNGLPFHSPTPAQETAAGLPPGVFGRLVQFIDPKFTNQKVYQASLSVEQQLGRDYAVEFGYLFYRGVHLPDPVLVGYSPSACPIPSTGPAPINPVVGPQYCEAAPYTTSVSGGEAFDFTSNGTSIYHGATVSVTKRFSHHVQFQGSYTWSRAIDDATDFNNSFASFRPNGLSVRQERGVSDFNRTNVFVVSGVYNTLKLAGGRSLVGHLLSDMTVGPVLSLSSGGPFDIVIGAPFNNGAPLPNNVSRPYTEQRNSGQGPGFDSTDLRFTKAIALNRGDTRGLSIQINVTNLFNAANFNHVNNFFPSSVAGSGIGSTAPLSSYVYTAAGNQTINFATGPFNAHGVRPSSLTQLQTNGGPLYFSGQAPPRSAQVGLSYYF